MAASQVSGKSTVIVVGCGVSGLTTALVLQQAGLKVRIVTASLPENTTSAVAAAIWFPYKSGPVEAVNRWSRETYAVLEALADQPETGVTMVDFLELVQTVEAAWWIDAVPAGAWRPALRSELPYGQNLGYVMRVPMMETPIYLRYLLDQFYKGGGEVALESVDELAGLLSDADLVVNCTGLGAKTLVPDDRMKPIQGQLIKIAVQPGIPYIAADAMEGAEAFEATYVFPRRDGIILGGTAIVGRDSLEWDQALGDRILLRCQALVPQLKDVEVLSTAAGLRPYRDEIRLERIGLLIHNYGHGGAGFTVSWGCAQEVLKLIQA